MDWFTVWETSGHRFRFTKWLRCYGGRGITVCERWNDYFNFIQDMGPRPNGYTIERINNQLGYCPENCVWASRTQQNQNHRGNHMVTFNGVTCCVKEMAELLGLSPKAIDHRLNKLGWSVEKTFSVPVRPRHVKRQSM